MATVEVRLSALPAHVRTARLIATAVARRAGVGETLLDEVRLAVGEACSRAVGLHQRHAPDEPVRLTLSDASARFTIEVADAAPEAASAADLSSLDAADLTAPDAGQDGFAEHLPSGFGLAVITGLVDDVDISATAAGTLVRMSWPLEASASRAG